MKLLALMALYFCLYIVGAFLMFICGAPIWAQVLGGWVVVGVTATVGAKR